MRQVTKQEFNDFIEGYPAKLSPHCVTIGDPPLLRYMDETTNKEVARIRMDWIGNDGELDEENHERFWRYFVN